ncbi:hypothetical protein CONCODRAFT_169119 [Conidiobolus coronatus NRRL 28638]|uniref:Uncharacterized protein n=1 Tax=Conidiobolus coronatus (strain ATCC 28846 / CBS 209.66 / NRRL 28638) TaxID=796925 RepID=A0A137NSK2_CONC2|nr:hypothetical protein CONCODRAFT_169119 [Conidiobolus coronatus NRRL 28638]|eukprot:KXN65753.1 hypothetical protein CONCODRAFT_169119 [Conidiobolus coronatus NRRL 28638]
MFGGSGINNNLETAKLENFQENDILRRSPINKCGNITYLSKENIERDMTNIPKWIFSCYGPVYDQDNIISGIEYSPEELRYEFYYEIRNLDKSYFQSNKKVQDLKQSAMSQLIGIRRDLNNVIFQYRQTTGYKGPILPMNAPPQCISTDKTFGQVLQQAIQRRSENKKNFEGGAHSSIFKSSTDVTGRQESAAFWGNTFSNAGLGGERAFGGGSSAFGGGNSDPSGAWSTFSQSQYTGSQRAFAPPTSTFGYSNRGGFAQFANPNSGFGSMNFNGDNGFETQTTTFDTISMDIDSPTAAALCNINDSFLQQSCTSDLPPAATKFKFSQTESPAVALTSVNMLSTENKLSKGYTLETCGGEEQKESLAKDVQLTIDQFEAFCFDIFEIGNIPLQPPPSILIKQL